MDDSMGIVYPLIESLIQKICSVTYIFKYLK